MFDRTNTTSGRLDERAIYRRRDRSERDWTIHYIDDFGNSYYTGEPNPKGVSNPLRLVCSSSITIIRTTGLWTIDNLPTRPIQIVPILIQNIAGRLEFEVFQ